MNQGCASYRRLLGRRDFFRVGGAGLFGLTWADFFRAEAAAGAAPKKAKQAIFIFLQGGPPQSDTFDMKPDRPDDIRGPFKPIKTVVPGLEVCEHLPRLAKAANRFSVLRSVNARGYPQAGDHFGGNTWKTGNPRGLRGTPKYPMYGSVVAKLCPAPPDVPAFAALGEIDTHAPGLKENYLGSGYDPLTINVDARRDKTLDPLTQMLVPAELDVTAFERNVKLLRRWSSNSASRMPPATSSPAWTGSSRRRSTCCAHLGCARPCAWTRSRRRTWSATPWRCRTMAR